MTDSTLKLLAAAGLMLSWFALTLSAWARHRRTLAPPAVPLGKIPVIYASQTGSAAALARQTVGALGEHRATALDIATLEPQVLQAATTALFIVSTCGEGDAPESAHDFLCRHMQSGTMNLRDLRYGLLALGDSRYRNFCGFGKQMAGWLDACGASAFFPPLWVDQLKHSQLDDWSARLHQNLGARDTPARLEDSVWTLNSRIHSNPGSVGLPCFHLLLEPAPGTAMQWSAGDIASILIEPYGVRRDYSIASVPSEGVLRLLVRRHTGPNGARGQGSDWLTTTLQEGQQVLLHFRHNPEFHAPDTNAPAVFIGNGTGIAGLRSLMQRRAELGHNTNWLIYGERQQAVDNHFKSDIERWLRDGQLERVNLTFSRDTGPQRYVYDALHGNADELCRWVQNGAYVYVCGSKAGMATDVDAALQAILGKALYGKLRGTNRYRCDVY